MTLALTLPQHIPHALFPSPPSHQQRLEQCLPILPLAQCLPSDLTGILTNIQNTLTALRVDVTGLNAKFDVVNAKVTALRVDVNDVNANVKELRTQKGHYAAFLGVVAVYKFLKPDIARYEDMEGNFLEL